MFKILDNNQVMRSEKSNSYEVWTHYGMKNQVQKTETETHVIYKWQEFDLAQNKYIDDTTNTDIIRVNETDYTPVCGMIEILKEA